MSILAGNQIVATDFVSTSAGAGDSGKVPKLNSSGKIDSSFLKFGGTGADGALSISSGTTTLDLASAALFTKNYTSISITGTGALAFINPNTFGTIIMLKSQGNITITSSATAAIDVSSLGASAACSGTSNVAGARPPFPQISAGGTYVAPGGLGGLRVTGQLVFAKSIPLSCGGGGGNGQQSGAGPNHFAGGGGASIINDGLSSSTAGVGGASGTDGTGGRGGGCLYMECAGAYNVSGTIKAIGGNGTVGSGTAKGGGGGGGGGEIVGLYNTLTANTGTYTVTAGAGSSGASVDGVAGGDGASLIALNTELS